MGKQAAALALASASNCQSQTSGFHPDDGSGRDPDKPTIESCGVCKSCKKIGSGNHPDIIQVQPKGPFIKIEQIRGLLQTLSMKPYEARTRVVIISEAHCMNAAASNALLKILEEPPDRSMLVLMATRKSDLLPTIASRCQSVKFDRISRQTINAWIAKEHGLNLQDAEIISATANGSLAKAQKMIDDDWMSGRGWVLNEMQTLSLQRLARLMALAEKLAREKEALAGRLEVISSWFRDLIINRYDSRKIINQDVAERIGIISRRTEVKKLLCKVKAIQEVQSRLSANTNLRLGLERLLIKLAQP